MKGVFSKVFAYDGKLIDLMTKFGELVLLSLVFLVSCLGVVTIGPAMSSLYYAVIKSIRRDRGSPLREYFSSFKRTLPKGVVLTLIWLVAGFALYSGYTASVSASEDAKVLTTVYVFAIALSVVSGVYIFPVLSRFEMKILKMIELAFVMGIRFFYFTVLIVLFAGLLIWLQIYILPIPCILFTPGVGCFLITFIMERALLYYMPKPKDGEAAWYYGGDRSKRADGESSEQKRGKE